MNASELFKAGQLQEALDAQLQEVKRNPADQSRRLFLFELLVFAGDLERARRQLDAVRYDKPEQEMGTAVYRKLLDAEQARRRVFGEGVPPLFLGEAPPHVALRLEALQRLRENKPAEAGQLLAQAHTLSPNLKGTLNEKPFASLRDYDDLLSGVLEVMMQDKYYWVPLEEVQALAMNPPRFPRDLIWFPTRLELRDGASGEVFLPALYPQSHEHTDNAVKLGRTTDWKETEGGPALGQGTRVFLVGDQALALLDWRKLEMN